MHVMTLNCTQNGDVRFHPDYAKVTLYGVTDTVNHHFGKALRDRNGDVAKTLKDVKCLIVNNVRIPVSMAEQFYFCIWYQKILSDSFTRTELSKYDDFFDGKQEEHINSQAKVFRMYKNGGTGALKSFCNDFLQLLKEGKSVEDNAVEQPIASEQTRCPEFSALAHFCSVFAKELVGREAEREDVSQISERKGYPAKNCGDVILEQRIKGLAEQLCGAYYDAYAGNSTTGFTTTVINNCQYEYNTNILGGE